MNPYFLKKFLYFRAIQGHSGEKFVDPLLQDNILLPDDFAEYNYHAGNACEMHSIIQSGLIPGRRSNKKNRQSVFFTAVNRLTFNLIEEKLTQRRRQPQDCTCGPCNCTTGTSTTKKTATGRNLNDQLDSPDHGKSLCATTGSQRPSK